MPFHSTDAKSLLPTSEVGCSANEEANKKKELISTLEASNVQVPADVTLPRLRSMCASLVSGAPAPGARSLERSTIKKTDATADTAADADATADTAADADAAADATADTNTDATADIDVNIDAAATDEMLNIMVSDTNPEAAIEVAVEALPRARTDADSVSVMTASSAGPTPSSAEERVNAQLRLLRKKRELLLLQQEVDALTITPPTMRSVDIGTIEAMVLPFSGDDHYDIRKWLADLEDAFAVLQVNEQAKFIACRRLLTGTARIFVRTIAVHGYNELKASLLLEFSRRFSAQEVYGQLRHRRLKPEESLRRYIIEMQEIALRADVPEEELVDLIVEGIDDKSQNVMLLMSATTVAELKRLADRYERKKLRPISMPSTTRPRRETAAPMPPKKEVTAAQTVTTDAPRCYNCSRFGHYQSQCPQPRRPEGSCFRCGQLNHVYRNCPNRPSRTAAAVEDNSATEVNTFNEVSVAFSVTELRNGNYTSVFSLLDSGSPKSFIRQSLLTDANTNLAVPTSYRGLGNQPLLSCGNIKCFIKFNNCISEQTLIVLPNTMTSVPMILGRDFLIKNKIKLCYIKTKYNKEELISLSRFIRIGKLADLMPKLKSLNLFKPFPDSSGLVTQVGESIVPKRIASPIYRFVGCTSYDETVKELCAITICEPEGTTVINPLLTDDQLITVESIIDTCYHKFPCAQKIDVDYRMKINLIHDTPIFSRPRRLSYHERTAVQKIVQDLLQDKIIRPSTSPYASALVLVPKKNGEIRMCIDYRPLNKITIRDNHPLPLIDDCLDHLGGKNFFTLLDLKSGFHQIRMHDDSVQYTSFVTPDGQYEYLCMPFGLRNSPPVFQRFINNVFRPLINEGKIAVYLDDILIASADFDVHLKILEEVLQLISKYRLTLNMKKCKFAYQEFEYLGYRANSSGILPSDAHLLAIQNYPAPKSRKELQRCLGLFSYFRRFVPSFSKLAYPMTRLLKKDAPYVFSDDCQKSFATLRQKLLEAPVLSIYDPLLETELHCDASAQGFGAVLLQRQTDNSLHPVAYFSKTTSPAEAKLHSYELETLAVVYALSRFHIYVEGIPFKIITDCSSLAQTLSHRNSSAKIARWALKLESYNYTIKHRPGTAMNHVDALSRVYAIVDNEDLDFQLSVAQNRDPEVLKIRSELESNEMDGYILSDGLVFRKSPSGKLQLYVPAEMVNNIIKFVHEKIGHQAVNKCCQQLQKHYWFPHMKNSVQNFIQNCIKCIMYSAPTRSKQQRNLYNIPKKPIPFDTLHIDHIGPLPTVTSKKKHLLVVIDSFTKFVKLYPARSTSSREACLALENYFQNYSRPRRIISDRGTCFTSQEFKNFLENRNVEHIKTASASPQANGQVERVNRVLRPALSKLSEGNYHSDWYLQLPKIEYALNNTVHSSTEVTPSVLLFGTEQRGPLVDELCEYLANKEPANDTARSELWNLASENINQSQEYNLQHFSRTHLPATEFTEGEFVVIKNVDTTAGLNKKLIPLYKGPYVIAKKLPNDRYMVRDIDGCQVTQMPYRGILEANKLKRWVRPPLNSSPTSTDVTLGLAELKDPLETDDSYLSTQVTS